MYYGTMRNKGYGFEIALFMLALCTFAGQAWAQARGAAEWPNYGNDPGGMRYSVATQIDRKNVAKLQVAWVFHTGDISDGNHGIRRSGFETTPLMVDDTLYLTTPFNRVIALDPVTGKQRWAYDPKVELGWDYGDGLVNRGVATWMDAERAAGKPCRRRIFEATLDARLIALDGATGKPCADFGKDGQISLRNVPGYRDGWYHMTSPPAVIDDLVIVGSAIDDNSQAEMPAGVVRAFDARTGALRWSWDPITPEPKSANSDAKPFRSGAANAWSVMSVDPQRDLVFVPTGSASPDYFGGLRPGDDKWANSVVALQARTGKVAWGFQLVHHDLWDYDSAAPPLLTTLQHGGASVPVVIQGNKTGFLYVLNRDTGVPVFPVEERHVPQSDVPGEVTSPTQPFPVAPPPLAPQKLLPDDVWGASAADREICRKWLGEMRNEGVFTPPSVKGTLAIPGNIGGLNWSGYAFDPERSLLIANVTNLPYKARVIPREEFNHRPADAEPGDYTAQTGTPYGMFRRPFFSPSHLPCFPGPWGTLAAVDMKEGKIRWQVPLGSLKLLAPDQSDLPQGSPSFGGPIVTAGGLIFVAGTLDSYVRAFDVESGKELWSFKLPAGGHATPMTYESHGKQYVVIAAGGHAKITEEEQGDALVAFALP